MSSSGDRHQDCGVQVQVEHHEEIKCLKLAIIAEEWLAHSGVWGSNHLVSIDPTQSRKVVHLEEDKIVII